MKVNYIFRNLQRSSGQVGALLVWAQAIGRVFAEDLGFRRDEFVSFHATISLALEASVARQTRATFLS